MQRGGFNEGGVFGVGISFADSGSVEPPARLPVALASDLDEEATSLASEDEQRFVNETTTTSRL